MATGNMGNAKTTWIPLVSIEHRREEAEHRALTSAAKRYEKERAKLGNLAKETEKESPRPQSPQTVLIVVCSCFEEMLDEMSGISLDSGGESVEIVLDKVSGDDMPTLNETYPAEVTPIIRWGQYVPASNNDMPELEPVDPAQQRPKSPRTGILKYNCVKNILDVNSGKIIKN